MRSTHFLERAGLELGRICKESEPMRDTHFLERVEVRLVRMKKKSK